MEKNPDCFGTEEEFNLFLGKTDHYKSLQEKIVKLANPQPNDIILELGAGIGATAIALAKKCRESRVIAIDRRQVVLDIAKDIARRGKIENIEFICYDMEKIGELIKSAKITPNKIVFLYSFHHVPDPNERKVDLAKDIFKFSAPNTEVIIGEGVVPLPANHDKYAHSVLSVENQRPKMAYLTVFWEEYLSARELGKSHEEALTIAKRTARDSERIEKLAGKKIAERNGEYPVTLKELKEIWESAGFKVLLSEEINVIGEAILLCVKE